MKIMVIDSGVQLYAPHRQYYFEHFYINESFAISREMLGADDAWATEFKNRIKKDRPDFIFIDPWIVLPGKRDDSFYKSNIVTNPQFDIRCQEVSDFLTQNTPCKVVIMGAWFDVHSLQPTDADILKSLLSSGNFYLWGLGLDSYKSSDSYSANSLSGSSRSPTNFYQAIMSDVRSRRGLISYLHAWPVDTKYRGNYGAPDSFEFDFHVPGSVSDKYPDRYRMLRAAQSRMGSDQVHLIQLLANIRKSYIKTKEVRLLRLMNYLYFDLIKKSRYNYADGGVMQYVTMKYLEIPSLGSVIVSPILQTLSEYGFEPERHYVSISANSSSECDFSVPGGSWVMCHVNSRELIFRRHSIEIRIRQLLVALECILRNEYEGTYYKNGVFHLNGVITN